MPGSIQVSVLDIKELPSSSNYVKVSLGKVEHETGEKGTFSFPLTNLRDNLIITIQDSKGNQVSHSGVRTMSIMEKGTWEDLFPIEGGGLIHMKLQFILSDEERDRIRSMRESAMKKKQNEILSSRLRNAESPKSLASSLRRHEVSDVLRATSSQDFQRISFNSDAAKAGLLTPLDDTSSKAAESSDGIKEESIHSQTLPNATDRREDTSFSPMTEAMHQKALVEDTESQAPPTDLAKKEEAAKRKPSGNLAVKLNEQNLEEKIPSNVKRTHEEGTSTPFLKETQVYSNKNNEIQLQQADVPEGLLEGVRQTALVEDTETRALTDLVKKNEVAKSKPLDNLAEKLDEQNLEEKIPSYEKRTSKESKPSPSFQETEVNIIKNNEIQLQASVPKRLQEASSHDVGSSRSIIAEKIKSFSPNLAGELDKHDPPEKTPRNIRKMISVFESSISQDGVPLKPLSTKSYRVGTKCLLKDHAVKDYSEKSESILGRVKNLGDKLISAKPKGTEKLPKDSTTVTSIGIIIEEKFVLTETSTKELPKSSEEGVNVEKFALTETNTKELPRSPEEGVNNEEKFALTETNTKELQESPEEGVNNENKVSLTATNTKKLPKSPEKDATVSGRMHADDKESNTKHTETLSNKIKDSIHAQGDRAMSLFGDCMVEEKRHQDKTVASIAESIVKGEVHCESDGIVKQGEKMVRISGNSSSKSSDEEASIGSLGQAIKVALVVGFGILVLLFQQREPRKGEKKKNNPALKNQVLVNKRQQPSKIAVLKLS